MSISATLQRELTRYLILSVSVCCSFVLHLLSCFLRSVFNNFAISGTSGSSGLGSFNKEQIDNRTLLMVKAGDLNREGKRGDNTQMTENKDKEQEQNISTAEKQQPLSYRFVSLCLSFFSSFFLPIIF